MHRYLWSVLAVTLVSGCAQTVNVAQEREALTAVDREWALTAKDVDKFMTFYAPDATSYMPNMPLIVGPAKIREAYSEMSKTPGFALQWTPAKTEVSSSGDIGYTAGSYQMTMGGATDKGKYITLWKKQPDGAWKVTEDILNSDAPAGPPTAQHVLTSPAALQWGPAPPSLPAGAKMAVVSGDPTKAEPFVIRAQFPGGYRVMPHWHPTDEHVTVLSGTLALGMGDSYDAAAAKDVPMGGYSVLPAQMHHYAVARTATTIQVHGMGPFVVNYVNPADDPSKQTK